MFRPCITRLISTLLWLGLCTATAQEIRRPTIDSETSGAGCTTVGPQASTSMPNFYDASGTATNSSLAVSGVGCASRFPTICATHSKGRSFSSWSAASGSYTSLSLNINSSCTPSGTDTTAADCTLQYSLDGGGTWNKVTGRNAANSWAQITDTISLSTSQSLANVQVRFCIDAFGDVGGTSSAGGAGTSTFVGFDTWTSGVLLTPPAQPTGLSATPAANGLSIQLTWTDNATTETSYQINKCTGVSCTPAAYQTGLAANTVSFNDTTGVSPGTTYGYQACAVNAAGGTCSATATATTPDVPATPSGLTGSFSNTTVSLSWIDNATTETSYSVLRCAGVGCTPTSFQTGLAANTTTFNDTTVNGRTTYLYRVVAVNAVGNSSVSNTFTIGTPSRQPNQSNHIIAQ